jgi:hypothetical protein
VERVEFVLGRSRSLELFFMIVHLGAGIVLVYVPIPIIVKILGLTLISISYRQILNLHLRRFTKQAIIRIWQDPKGRWGCQSRAGHLAIGELKNDTYKSRWLIILRLRFRTRSQNILIPKDALNSSEYRVLCARLNLSSGKL